MVMSTRCISLLITCYCVGTGLEPERRAFHPHITLARWNRRSEAVSRFLQRNRGLASTPFAVKAFTLYESHLSRHGAHYEAVADYGLCVASRRFCLICSRRPPL